jgi:hypothetical protein
MYCAPDCVELCACASASLEAATATGMTAAMVATTQRRVIDWRANSAPSAPSRQDQCGVLVGFDFALFNASEGLDLLKFLR